jgi:hypothetical protein
MYLDDPRKIRNKNTKEEKRRKKREKQTVKRKNGSKNVMNEISKKEITCLFCFCIVSFLTFYLNFKDFLLVYIIPDDASRKLAKARM